MKAVKKSPKIKLIVSEDENPSVKLRPGLKILVEEFELVDTNLKNLHKKIGARLCGGSGTCLALVDIGDEINPIP